LLQGEPLRDSTCFESLSVKIRRQLILVDEPGKIS